MVTRMRVVFMGTPEFAVSSLRALLTSQYEVAAVFTQPDRPAGRGKQVQPPPVKQEAVRAGIPVFQPEKVRLEENRPLLERLAPDFLVVVAFGQILPGWLLRLPRIAPVNVHGSLLPKYRGAAPVAWAILNGDTVTGITTMLMDEGMDTGPMLLKREVPIPDEATSGELTLEMARVGAALLLPTLDGLVAGSLNPTPQDPAEASLAPRIRKEMGQIDWGHTAAALHNRVRALHPWPLAFTTFRGQKLQVLRTAPATGYAAATPAADGTFLGTTGRGMLVACGRGSRIELLEVQMESRKPVSGREFAAGARISPGERVCAQASAGDQR
jgi:methionyl-tRNA formyltransferase